MADVPSAPAFDAVALLRAAADYGELRTRAEGGESISVLICLGAMGLNWATVNGEHVERYGVEWQAIAQRPRAAMLLAALIEALRAPEDPIHA